jgi:hypothetical protein
MWILSLSIRTNPLYLIGECKRVNPAFSIWCFARSDFTRRNPYNTKLIIQKAWQTETASQRIVTGISLERADQIYHLGLEIKSNKKGEDLGQPKGAAFDRAAEQVCLGINGMIEFFAARPSLLTGRGNVHLLPVIFTTARIFSSKVDLGSANLETGDLQTGSVDLTEQPWIWWQYNLSPTLTHSQPVKNAARTLEGVLEQEFCRSIAIVSPQGIEGFLARDWWFTEL